MRIECAQEKIKEADLKTKTRLKDCAVKIMKEESEKKGVPEIIDEDFKLVPPSEGDNTEPEKIEPTINKKISDTIEKT